MIHTNFSPVFMALYVRKDACADLNRMCFRRISDVLINYANLSFGDHR
jgi:hypothetical protein